MLHLFHKLIARIAPMQRSVHFQRGLHLTNPYERHMRRATDIRDLENRLRDYDDTVAMHGE